MNERSFDWIRLGESAVGVAEKLGESSGVFNPNVPNEIYYHIGFNRYVVLRADRSKATGLDLITQVYLANSSRIIRILKGHDTTQVCDMKTPFQPQWSAEITHEQIDSLHTLDELKTLLGELPPIRSAKGYNEYTVVWLNDGRIYYVFFRAHGYEQAETQLGFRQEYPWPKVLTLQYDIDYDAEMRKIIWKRDWPEKLRLRAE